MAWWQLAVAVAAGVLLVWTVLVVALYLAGRQDARGTDLRSVLRLVPDVVRLLRRLSRDPEVPPGVRVRLLLLLVYLVSPIDLVPDFIPVVGYADDAIVVALAIRSVVRAAGPEALERHWPGTPEGLRAVRRLARISD